MTWNVQLNRKAKKEFDSLPAAIQIIADLLFKELELSGPVRSNWKNYSKLRGHADCYHLK